MNEIILFLYGLIQSARTSPWQHDRAYLDDFRSHLSRSLGYAVCGDEVYRGRHDVDLKAIDFVCYCRCFQDTAHKSKILIYCSPWGMSIVSKLDALKTSRVESSTSDNPIQVLQ